jgi:diaminohydroxyphosphoribosylaminopyrimidine deaminase/5-amino-6-(5-phosphoribosylamino)uracil reductase
MAVHETFMRRCLDLAIRGQGYVAPNPLVGAVLVHQGRIIGEGWHEAFGKAHAEVNCFQSVAPEDRPLIAESVLYVSLEPCAHQGKTPPCTSLIINERVSKVVVGCLDPFPAVSGKGIEQLKEAGIEVEVGVLREECRWVNRRFMTTQEKNRPHVVLKWAQTNNGFIGTGTNERLLISNTFTNKQVHTWRSEEAAILIGSNTAKLDNPLLTSRWGNQRQPVRVLVDRQLSLPMDLRIFQEQKGRICIINEVYEKTEDCFQWILMKPAQNGVVSILNALHQINIQSVLIEGGRQLLQLFIDYNLWDEARVITAINRTVESGVTAPDFRGMKVREKIQLANDHIGWIVNHQAS